MANYHQHIKPIQRSKGSSAVAAAAYRSASKLTDELTGEVHDYTKKEHVDSGTIIGWSGTRDALWNAAEAAEKRKDATTAREYEVSLPIELNSSQQQTLATQYGFWLYEEYGVAVDINIHKMDSPNPHAHILTTTRVVVDEQTLTDKSHREWSGSMREQAGLVSRKIDLISARKKWAELCNTALKDAGHVEQVDHRSYAEQGILIQPQIHIGVHALAEYKKTGVSERVEKNNEIIARQKKARLLLEERDQLSRQINYLKFQQFYMLCQLKNNKVKYYINAFPLVEKVQADLTSKQNTPVELDIWGFPISGQQTSGEEETDWFSHDDLAPDSMDYLDDVENDLPDNFAPDQL